MTQYRSRHAKPTTVLCFLLAAQKLRQQNFMCSFIPHPCYCVRVFGCVQCLYVRSCVHVCTHVHHVCACMPCMCFCLSDGCSLIPFSHLLIRLCLMHLPICWKQFYLPFSFFSPPPCQTPTFAKKAFTLP